MIKIRRVKLEGQLCAIFVPLLKFGCFLQGNTTPMGAMMKSFSPTLG